MAFTNKDGCAIKKVVLGVLDMYRSFRLVVSCVGSFLLTFLIGMIYFALHPQRTVVTITIPSNDIAVQETERALEALRTALDNRCVVVTPIYDMSGQSVPGAYYIRAADKSALNILQVDLAAKRIRIVSKHGERQYKNIGDAVAAVEHLLSSVPYFDETCLAEPEIPAEALRAHPQPQTPP